MDTSLYGRGNGYSTIACNPISTDAIYPIYHTLLSGALSTPAGARSLNARFNRVCATVPAPSGLLASCRLASPRLDPRRTMFFESRHRRNARRDAEGAGSKWTSNGDLCVNDEEKEYS